GCCSGPTGSWVMAGLTTDGFALQPFEFLIAEDHRLAEGDVILPQWKPLPGRRHQDAAQVRVPVELDAEQVPGLPLVPVGGGPDRGKARDVRIGHGRGGLDPNPGLVGQRAYLPDDGEAWVASRPIDGGGIETVIESFLIPEIAGDIDQAGGIDHDAEVASEVGTLLNGRLEAVAEPLHERVGRVRTHLALLQCWRDDPAVRRDA